MGSLIIGDPGNIVASEKSWADFKQQLVFYKKIGIDAISTDVWWGLVEINDKDYHWDYYDKVSKLIFEHGLQWVPILSFHQCGGNVGDNYNIPIPKWIWTKYSENSNLLKYKSEQGNYSEEVVSVWATHLVLSEYESFISSFIKRYQKFANNIQEINISLGPAGELRYPAYNSHDENLHFPSRGALQAYSELAIESFRDFIKKKYKSIKNLNRSWSNSGLTFENITPPGSPQVFFDCKEFEASKYGYDFFEWYQASLINHGRDVMGIAIKKIREFKEFDNTCIGAKVPGLHWRIGKLSDGKLELFEREIELAAGLIHPSLYREEWYSSEDGFGYKEVVGLFKSLAEYDPQKRTVMHFTCLEMNDGDGQRPEASLAKTLVKWVGEEAKRQGVNIKGENAIGPLMKYKFAWDNIENALENSGYSGLTILRMDELMENDYGKSRLSELVKKFTIVDQ